MSIKIGNRAVTESFKFDHTAEDRLVVTEAVISGFGPKAFVIDWATKGAGFGQLSIYIDETGQLRCDTETMGRAFAQEVLSKLLESAVIDDYDSSSSSEEDA